MKQNHSLTFAILLACCVLAVSRQFATNRLKGFIKNKRLQVAFTHARVRMGASVYSPGPEED